MAELTKLVARLERRVQPSDEAFRFSVVDLEEEVMEALVYLDPDLTLDELTAGQELSVLYKAMSSCYYGLAAKYAENIRFRIENDEYFGQQTFQHYMALGKQYEEKFQSNTSIQVNTVTRTQTGTGLKAGYYPGDKP